MAPNNACPRQWKSTFKWSEKAPGRVVGERKFISSKNFLQSIMEREAATEISPIIT
jgi:hypothetical protein